MKYLLTISFLVFCGALLFTTQASAQSNGYWEKYWRQGEWHERFVPYERGRSVVRREVRSTRYYDDDRYDDDDYDEVEETAPSVYERRTHKSSHWEVTVTTESSNYGGYYPWRRYGRWRSIPGVTVRRVWGRESHTTIVR